MTFGPKGGAKITDRLEAYGAVERYQQNGKSYDRHAPGALSNFDLFGGTRSVSVMAGLKVTFP